MNSDRSFMENGQTNYEEGAGDSGGGGGQPHASVALYVGNLDYGTTEDGLHGEFSKFGPVVSVSIPIDRSNNRPKGYGFVTMANRQDAEDAIVKLDQSEFQGRTIRVSESRPRRDGPPPRFMDQRFEDRAFNDNRGPPPEREFGGGAGRPPAVASSSQVQFWVGNLSFRTTDRELVNIFRSFGEVVDCSVPVHRENGKPRGYGFVTLKGVSPKDAIHICRELDGTDLDGRSISVMEARQKDRGPPGGGRGGYGDRGGYGSSGYGGGRRDFGGGRDDSRPPRFEDRGGRGDGRFDRGSDFSGGNDRGRREYNEAY